MWQIKPFDLQEVQVAQSLKSGTRVTVSMGKSMNTGTSNSYVLIFILLKFVDMLRQSAVYSNTLLHASFSSKVELVLTSANFSYIPKKHDYH
mgnify:CR=1 FL=1